jgi:O-methyltransferase involved in polyketide biosynthesis
LVGAEAESLAATLRAMFGDGTSRLTTWIAARSRFTEDWLEGSGAAQYVVLGAGLDSFAWRQSGQLPVFEVDHPATQESKRSRLDALGIADLSLHAIHATLAEIPPCMLAVSHATPEDMWPDDVRTMSNTFRSIAAQAGEPPMTWFAPDQFADLLAEHGFEVLERAGYWDVEPRWGLPALNIGDERVILAVKRD